MIESICKRVVGRMLAYEMIDMRVADIYVYELQVFVESLIGHIFLLILALLLNRLLELVLFIVVFDVIRQFSSGFHCRTSLGCFVFSLALCIGVELMESICKSHFSIYQWVVLLSMLLVVCIGAVNHPDMNWSVEELTYTKRKSRLVTIIITALIMFLSLTRIELTYLYYMGMGIVVCSLSLLTEILRKEIKLNE